MVRMVEGMTKNFIFATYNSSGQGVIPDRRYSPLGLLAMNRCNSGTDSKVWMEERFNMINSKDTEFLRQAMTLAQCGEGAVNPNPLVGALIVRDGSVVAQGYHARYGDLHAERNAFRDADTRGVDCAGATMYVTLEPCCHHGKQPPCTEAIIEHKIARVVVGLLDPNPLVAGHGIEILLEAGIEVEVIDQTSELAQEMKFQNRVFLRFITTKRPWIVAKYAMTLDGKICTYTRDSQWISGSSSRQYVHKLRKVHTAILCGIGTVLADDPMLNTRIPDEPSARNPIRIVMDRHLRIPLDCQLVKTAQQITTIVVCNKEVPEKTQQLKDAGVQIWACTSLDEMLQRAGEAKIDSILIEGGGTINEAFLHEGLIDEIYAFIAPKLVGGVDAKTPVEGQGFAQLKDALQLHTISVEQIGEDILIHCIKK